MPAKSIKTIRLQGFDLENGRLPKPLHEKTDLTRLVKEQSYNQYSTARVKEIVICMQVEESLEELLAALR